MPRITLGLTTAALALTAILAAHPRFAPAAVLDTYIGPTGGNWTTLGNWSLNQVPNSAAFDVLINTPVSVKLDAAQTINDLSINASSSLALNANLIVAGNLNVAGSLAALPAALLSSATSMSPAACSAMSHLAVP